MKKLANSCNFRRQLFVLSTAVAFAALGGAAISRADSGVAIQPVGAVNTSTGHGVVKGERSNVRSRPSIHSEVITQLRKGDTVDVLERQTVTEHEKSMDWLRVSLPATAKCYVSAKHLNDGTVNVENLNVRCGPGATYREIGKLAKGTRVEILEKKGAWVQIRPPAECSGWITAELVDVQAAPAAPVVVPVTEQPTSPGEIVTPAVAAPTGPSVSVVNTDPDVLVTYAVKDGYLGSVSETNAPQAFELRTAEEDRISLRMAYLEASGMNLKKFDGKHVRIVGTQRWRKGERYPVITIERIDMVW
jgi:uncharacterized protein YgiM (DUF1202 family)